MFGLKGKPTKNARDYRIEHALCNMTVGGLGKNFIQKLTWWQKARKLRKPREVSKKRRGSYLTYLSNPSEKVPRTSEYRQKLSSEVSLSFQDKSSPDNCQTNDNTADSNSYQQENDENDS